MTIDPSDDKLSEVSTPSNPNQTNEQSQKAQTPFERSQFGGTQRQHRNDEDVPISRSDLRKGAR